ncbi:MULTISPECIES: toxin [unclassified Microcoleus]|uniref:Tc toxin subunit A-related protein n=1 Tax=unclassified Microcoleus TaxID=2642155 RepID=UPI001D63067D|nr:MULTISPECIES: toxin [unclassified Microcoleus]MCC3501385.1 toxin [Microcoleus sp. PH2017_19_SFW_U_A]TAG99296.1 MAG: insecticidal toxin protein [Oscillatoriales cyanobacterium]MCC3473818.1 toxin [Microcoleus sp. PH2017_13_LAR_U_A]MCC3486255.1 toxin [Microcoleus sp. PH2017_14_LAR_D_A]MCC3496758.1 toxin [Microcoleus sp. PH2017_15_JOR_U_A]
MKPTELSQFHGYYDAKVRPYLGYNSELGWTTEVTRKHTTIQERKLSYQFYSHFHPYVAELVQRLIAKSVSGLQATDTEYLQNDDGSFQTFPATHPNEALRGKPIPKLYQKIFSSYNPSDLVQQPHPVKDLDFTSSGAYSVYNWELFYHVPITIAIHLSKNQRFEESQRWFHYIFDPTDDSDGPTPERFWKVKPFQYTDVKLIEEILVNLASGADPKLQEDTVNSINNLKENPFRPHIVARYRHSAYMFKTVMAYLDNLIDWGDSLFRQDTGESINEATMLYVLAANLLGTRPQVVPKKGSVRPQTYANLRADLDEFGNALREIETDIPFDLTPHPTAASNSDQSIMLKGIGKALYFCIPRNDKLLSYWDTVADRLFKIRNSLNIQGIFRQLPLFEPPIDPALLARATAAGLDVGAVISGINQPLPLVRFQVLAQKATEICQEVKSLGNNLLSAIEKEDNEAIAMLRATHDRLILGIAESVKYAQWQEAIKTREGLEQSLMNAAQRYIYYERQLGKKDNEIQIPQLDALDKDNLLKMKFQQGESALGLRPIDVDIAQDLNESGGKIVSSHEVEEMAALKEARDKQESAAMLDKIAGGLATIPNFGAHFQPFGPGGSISFGGSNLSAHVSYLSSFDKTNADRKTYGASRSAKIGSYARREQEWAFQSNTIAGEITQTLKQLRAAQIREAIAEREWKNHQTQIKNTEEIQQFLKGEETQIGGKKHKKVSTQAFYTWMKREVKGLYGQCFQFAFDTAKKAERALQHELGKPELSFLQFGYLSGKEGLLAGEKLYLDIKRMEMAYHDLNQREYELTKHVSLLQVNPLELLKLRTTGRCTVTLPEELFDMDCPGHYFRRIKNVAVSIPCVTGPYTSVNCTLTLTKSSIRKSALLGDDYARVDAEDTRFSDYFGSLQSIVTSSGQNDSGLFETNLRDDRYLPFEGSGVVSEWQLQLPANPSNQDPLQFDYNTISDIILHLRYTAREGGQLLKNGAIEHLKNQINAAQTIGSVRLFSMRHEFPTGWAKFKSVKIEGATTKAEIKLEIGQEHFPYWSKGRLGTIEQILVHTKTSTGIVPQNPSSSEVEVITQKPDGKTSSQAFAALTNISLPQLPDKFRLNLKLSFNTNLMEDLWLTVTWGKQE